MEYKMMIPSRIDDVKTEKTTDVMNISQRNDVISVICYSLRMETSAYIEKKFFSDQRVERERMFIVQYI